MSYKPYQGSGVLYFKAYEKAEKYRMLFYNEIDILTFESLKKASYYLFIWLNNENKISPIKRTASNSINRIYFERLKRNENIIHSKLTPFLT